tara:strand:- start:3711 stop:4262 length:552 start_codon:yes stop_codon:yes gene_type:complete
MINLPIILDDVFTDNDMFHIYEDAVNMNQWKYDVSSMRQGLFGNISNHRFWGIKFLNDNTNYFNDITPSWIPQLLPYLDHRTEGKLELLKRDIKFAHFNGQTFGQDGEFHQDFDITVFVFVGPVPWKEEWGGELIMKDTDSEKESIYSFKPGRCMIVDGRKPHKGLGPLVKNILRISLAIHLK